MSKAKIHPDHLRKSGSKLEKFGGTVQQAGQKLEETGQNLVSHASGDRSGVGSVVAKFTGRATEIAGKTFKEGGRVAGSAGKRLGTTADLYEEADTTAAKNLRRHHPDVKGKVDPHGGSRRKGATVGTSGGGSGKKKPKRVPGGTGRTEKVGARSAGPDHKAPAIPGGGGDPARLKGRLPHPDSAEAHLPELLERHGVTQQEFDSMRHRMNQPGGTANVTHEEAMKWRAIREDIPLDRGTPVQKVLSPYAAEKYINDDKSDGFKTDMIRGCFARTVDVKTMPAPSDLREGLRLDYPGTPFEEGVKSVYVFRTNVSDGGEYAIPFGGPNKEGARNIGGTTRMDDPFTGNGFTGSNHHLVPEWDRKPTSVQTGDAIYLMREGVPDQRVAHYVKNVGWIKD